MRRPQGHATLIEPDRGKTVERDTVTCGHCQRIVHVAPRCDPADIGGLCKICMSLICPRCVKRDGCTPWEKQMEQMEARQDALRSYGL